MDTIWTGGFPSNGVCFYTDIAGPFNFCRTISFFDFNEGIFTYISKIC